MDKKSVLLSQVIMTFIMASTMSGAMGLVAAGSPTVQWLTTWPKHFIVAWPIAFALTMLAWPASIALTRTILRPRGLPEAQPEA